MSFPGVRGRARGLRAVFSGQGTSSAPRDLFTASSRLVRGNLFTEAQRETQPIAMTWRVIQNPDLRGWFFCLFRGCGCVLVEGEDLSLGQLDHRTRQYSQNRSSHGPCNRPASRSNRRPQPNPRPQLPPSPADHWAATGTEPERRDQGHWPTCGATAPEPNWPSRSGPVGPRPAGPSAGGRPVLSRSSRTSCPPQTTWTRPGP